MCFEYTSSSLNRLAHVSDLLRLDNDCSRCHCCYCCFVVLSSSFVVVVAAVGFQSGATQAKAATRDIETGKWNGCPRPTERHCWSPAPTGGRAEKDKAARKGKPWHYRGIDDAKRTPGRTSSKRKYLFMHLLPKYHVVNMYVCIYDCLPCMYVCIYVHTSVCVCVTTLCMYCISINPPIRIYVSVLVLSVCMCVCINVHVCVHKCVFVMCMYSFIHSFWPFL